MNPDINLRVKSLVKALSDVILPAVPESERLARDQIGLVIGHLNVIAEQWQYALRYEIIALEEAAALARQLVGLIDDDALAHELEQGLKSLDIIPRDDFNAVSDAHIAIKTLIDRAISAGYTRAPMSTGLCAAVLNYNQTRALRERTWHQGSGLDPDSAALPAIATLFD